MQTNAELRIQNPATLAFYSDIRRWAFGVGRSIFACNTPWRWVGIISCLTLASCGGTHHFRSTTPAEMSSAPPYLELRSEPSAGTLHFPRGTYVLDAVDDNGYYYRAPRKIVQHSFSGNVGRAGGIFVAKRDQRRLRGYVILSSGLTHVGNLSRARHEFRY